MGFGAVSRSLFLLAQQFGGSQFLGFVLTYSAVLLHFP